MPTDRRVHARTDVRYEVAYDYYALDGRKLGSGYAVTINVSANGILLETDRLLEEDMPLLVEMISPLYTFMATGQVVYTQQIDDTRFRVGVSLREVIQGGWEPLMAGSRR